MGRNKMWKSFNEIIEIAETNPSQQIWCINDEGTIDFITTAKDIKNTVGNFNWEGVNFGIVGKNDDEAHDEQSDELQVPEEQVGELQISAKKITHKIEVIKTSNAVELSTIANNFMENKQIVNIEYQTNTVIAPKHAVEYSVMIHYIEED